MFLESHLTDLALSRNIWPNLPEHELPPRRLASLLIIWLSLFSVAAPAIACQAATRHGDCCPPQGKPPCGECPEKRPDRGLSPQHCLAAPGSAATSSSVSEPARKLIDVDLEPAATLPVNSDPQSLDDSNYSIRHRWRPPPVTAQTPAYLISGRLRL